MAHEQGEAVIVLDDTEDGFYIDSFVFLSLL